MSTTTLSKQVDFIRRAGYAGFAFFMIKGLLWLIVPLMFARFV